MRQPDYVPTTANLLRRQAAAHGPRLALGCGDQRLTYSDLDRKSARLALGLLSSGVGKGCRVGLLMPNSPDWVSVFMAATRIGAIVVPLSTLYQAAELGWVINHADIELLIVADSYLRHDYLTRLEQALPSLADQTGDRLWVPEAPYLRQILVWGPCDRGWGREAGTTLEVAARAAPQSDEFLRAVEANVTPADPACIIYTSGSTADPKGVVHLHGPLIRHSYQMAVDYWPFGEGDIIASFRPYFWVAGLSATLMHALHVGAGLIQVVPDDASELRRLIEEENVVGLAGAQKWFAQTGSAPAFADGKYAFKQLSADCTGVAIRRSENWELVSPGLQRLVESAPFPLPTELLPRNFGMTETLGAHTALPSPQLLPPDKIGSCGRAVPGVVQQIRDTSTGKPVPPGEFGELLVGGYSLMDGLYKRERSDVFTDDGLYPTGDVCAVDDDGILAFKSRLGDMVKVNGANVAPPEVERVLMAMPEIDEAAVLGLPASGSDSMLVAAVSLQPGARITEEALIARMKQSLSSYKSPQRFFFLSNDDWPRTGSGKLQKSRLAAALAQKLNR